MVVLLCVTKRGECFLNR